MLNMDDLFKGRQFDREIIVLCVRWYLRFKLSFRDPVEMLAERGISLAHTTIMRWIQRYVPEFERRCNRFAQPRVDLGVSTKPTSRSRAVGRIFIVRSTKRQRLSIFCCAQSGMSPPPMRSSGTFCKPDTTDRWDWEWDDEPSQSESGRLDAANFDHEVARPARLWAFEI
jgi:hypothetical protein